MKVLIYLLIILFLALIISHILKFFTKRIEGIENCSQGKQEMVIDNKAKINSMSKTLNDMKLFLDILANKADKNKRLNGINERRITEVSDKQANEAKQKVSGLSK
jgi:uncharacterized membrane protein